MADADGKAMHSWRILILPYIEQNELYNEYRFDEPWDGPNNRKLASRMPRLFALHGEKREGNTTTSYLAVIGPNTFWQDSTGVPTNAVMDDKSHTILLVENKGADIHWMEPRDLSFTDMDFAINSPNGISSRYVDPAVVMGDGEIFRLTNKVEPQTLWAMLTINGGESVSWDEAHGGHLLPDGRQRPVREP